MSTDLESIESLCERLGSGDPEWGALRDIHIPSLIAEVRVLRADANRVGAGLGRILNDKDSYEYEGLSWSAVDEIRTLTGIKAPEGGWLA